MLELIFEKTIGKALLGAGLVAALVVWWQIDRSHQREIGALTERAEQTERANAEIERAEDVRRASERARLERLRGVVADPYAAVPRRER